MAFQDYKVRKGIWGSEFIGFANFIKFFKSYNASNIIANTLILSIYGMLASMPFSIIFALVLNTLKNERLKKLCQTIVCMPYFISTVVLVGILFQVLDARTGLYGSICYELLGHYPRDLFGSADNFRHLYVWSGVWQGFGWGSIIYTAALSNVDQQLHEAAQLDGATNFQRVIHIDLPSILPTIIIMLILSCGSIMGVGFEKVFLMQNSLNLSASQVISTYTYDVALSASGVSDFSYASAIGLFNSVVGLVMLTIVNKIAKKLGDTSLW